MLRLLTVLLFSLFANLVLAQSNDEYKSVQLQVSINEEPLQINLSWDDAVTASSDILIYRRDAGTSSWGAPLATVAPGTVSYADMDIEMGAAYEYRLTRPHSSGVGNGYLYSSTALEAPSQRGVLILVIDDELLPDLSAEILRYRTDVEADGWSVTMLLVNAASQDTLIKNGIQEIYQRAPERRHALFLLGNIPVPYSGNISPDGHNNHVGAWSSDVYYADMDGNWTDQSIDNTTASSTRNHNVPGDGKWDQSTIPSDVELETGRVDFSNLPLFTEDMVELTRQYLDKNHAFRRKHFSVPPRGLIENNFGGFTEGFGQNGLKNFSTLVGRDSTYYRDYNTLKTESYLFSYGCGGGNYQGASGIANTTAMAADSFQTVFTLLFGSYFGDWDSQNNFLRAALGSGTILANAWAGRPNWSLHPMGLGETIGYCAKLTQNNAGFSYDAGFGNRSAHVALMGDPTLRMHILAPPTDFVVAENDEGVVLSWTAPAEDNIAGYHLYKRNADTAFYERITEDMITDLNYLDACPALGDSLQYLVKTVRLETTPSGRFYNESTGVAAGIVPIIDRAVVAAFVADINGEEVGFTNQSTNATSYSWDFGDGATSMEEEPIHIYEDGQYTVRLIAANACGADTSTFLINIMTVGTTDLADLGVQVLPNPVTNGQIYIRWNQSYHQATLRLVDVLGRTRMQTTLRGQREETLSLNGLEDGVYFLQLEMDGRRAQQQIVLNRN